ncbi:MAG: hypothetical protein A2176_12985 [Spirochaetes bacterium RBG_13_51_14]|nr:MAG: hypothetical protein A2176_12985 [Spirochaetes bacterium RBG_13_51_14]
MNKAALLFLMIVIISMASCTSLKQRLSIKKCTFKLADVNIGTVSLSDMTMGLRVAIVNPNDIEVIMDRMDLDLYIGDVKTVNIVFNGVTIPPRQTKTVNAMLTIPYKIMGMSAAGIAGRSGDIQYRLSGTVSMSTLLGVVRFPVTISKN